MGPLQGVGEGDGTLKEQNTPLNTFERKRHKNEQVKNNKIKRICFQV